MEQSMETEKNSLQINLNHLTSNKTASTAILTKMQEQRGKLVAQMNLISNLQEDVRQYDMSKNDYWQGQKEEMAENLQKVLETNLTDYYDACDTLKSQIDSAISRANNSITNIQAQIDTTTTQLASIEKNQN
ncbi:YwqH-like family protein [Anaerosacchariphilus polymeriproducens]|uniref:DUF5082 domain-containing protein n=1 Tax=Anaerosacchariphilus polymeriproducens TaxID=1812858 RepID=A0A371ARZ3_9FIRM|nr:DUF5082 family protein [Anaerosacchariphilus polymeriproducens]RDU22326.1 DUF5082 domain-containing protein [Anaerosacchariphilus polymeriproducens]